MAHHSTRVCLTSFSWILLTYSDTYFVRVCILPDYVPMNCSFWLSVSISSQPLSVFLKLPHLPSKFSVINSPWQDKAEPHGTLRSPANSQTLNTMSWTVAAALSHDTLARIMKTEPQVAKRQPWSHRLLWTPSSERSLWHWGWWATWETADLTLWGATENPVNETFISAIFLTNPVIW